MPTSLAVRRPRARSSRALLSALSVLTAACVLAVVAPVQPAAAAEVLPVPGDRVFRVEGRGFGHGRGMSQHGAYGAARAGVGHRAILSTYYPGTTFGDIADPLIRVRVTGSDAASITVTGALAAVDEVRGGGTIPLPAGTNSCTFTRGGAGVDVACASPAGPTTLTMREPQVRGTGGLTLRMPSGSTRVYRGALRLPALDAGTLTAVVSLGMQEYLQGVVAREMPSSWHPEALAAQAVAARTYAESARRRVSGSGAWDICDSQACQVFGGVADEAGSTSAAVAATRGTVLLYQGKPAFAEYSSSNGGWTVAGSVPYQVAKEDPWDALVPNSVSSWTSTLPASAIESRFPAVGRLDRIVILRRDGRGPLGGRILAAALEGTGGRVEVTGDQLRFSYGYSSAARDGLKSSWFRVTDERGNNPVGSLDAVSAGADGNVTVRGWALDPDTTASASVHVYVDGTLRSTLAADRPRDDVARAYPSFGANRGFEVAVPGRPGATVCVYAINVGQGTTNATLGCRTVGPAAPPPPPATGPRGSLDAAVTRVGTVEVSGWALDPARAAPLDVHVYVDVTLGAVTRADTPRPDVARHYPAAGPNHGWSASVPVLGGAHRLCAYAIGGSNPALGCKVVDVPSDPVGALDSVSTAPGSVTLAGWALDPDTTDATRVHLYVDGRAATGLGTGGPRPDVARQYPTYGPSRGWVGTLPVASGRHTVCAYAINTGRGSANPLLGCRTVDVP